MFWSYYHTLDENKIGNLQPTQHFNSFNPDIAPDTKKKPQAN